MEETTVVNEEVKSEVSIDNASPSELRKTVLSKAEEALQKVSDDFDPDVEIEKDIKLKPLTIDQLSKYDQETIDKYNFILLYQDDDKGAEANIEQYVYDHPSLKEHATNLKILKGKTKEEKDEYINFLVYDFNYAAIQVIYNEEQNKLNKLVKSYMPVEMINVFFSKNRVIYGNELFKSVYDDTISLNTIKQIVSKHGFIKSINRHSKPVRYKRMLERIAYVSCRFAKNKQSSVYAILDRTIELLPEVFGVTEEVAKAYVIALAIYANRVNIDNIVECATMYFMVNAVIGMNNMTTELLDKDAELDEDAAKYYYNLKECLDIITEVISKKENE